MPGIRIGIFGGTFNPPHIGHTEAAKAAYNALKLDKLIFVPAAEPPHKKLPTYSATPEQRLEMIRLAAARLPFAEVSDCEIVRKGKSYTVDTLYDFHSRYPNDQMWLVCGTDMFFTIEQWHRAEEIFPLCILAPLLRDGSVTEKQMREHAKRLQDRYGAKTDMIVHKAVDISSTKLRGMIGTEACREYLDPDVYSYIETKGIYCVHH